MISNQLKQYKLKTKFNIVPSSYKEMNIVAGFIRSSAEWYAKFVGKEDLDEHYVSQKWIDKNYTLRDFYIGYENESEPIGTISLQDFGDYLYVGYLYLDTKHVGKRYGHKLLDFAMSKAIKQNKKGLVLICHPEATWATKAYLKYGFKKIASTDEEVRSWNNEALKGYHEEGFELYFCSK